MPEFIVHIKRHSGWHTTTAEGDTFGEAAVKAVIATCKQFGLDVNTIPHTVEYGEEVLPRILSEPFRYRRVLFTETGERDVFDPHRGGWVTTQPGDIWFAERVEEGKPGDCPACGGTGIDFYNPFRGCRSCTDGTIRRKHAS